MNWIPVRERLPEDGVEVLTATDCGVDGWFYSVGLLESRHGGRWWQDNNVELGLEPDYWMPLPEAPK